MRLGNSKFYLLNGDSKSPVQDSRRRSRMQQNEKSTVAA